jgi:hypothetical protein
MRAMGREPYRHFLAKPGASARDQDPLALKQGSVEHGVFLPCGAILIALRCAWPEPTHNSYTSVLIL